MASWAGCAGDKPAGGKAVGIQTASDTPVDKAPCLGQHLFRRVPRSKPRRGADGRSTRPARMHQSL